jgi:arylsulfatase
METIDEEVTKASLEYLEKAKKADKPFFLWWNSTRMHIWTRLKAESRPASASTPTAWWNTTGWSGSSSTS